MVRGRADALRGARSSAPRLPVARALPLRHRAGRASCCCCCRACPGSARRSTARTSASTSARSPSSRPSSRRSRSSSSWPATCATRARCWSAARAVRRASRSRRSSTSGPLLVVWGAAMVLLVFIRDLGSSLMFFGALPRAHLRGDQPPRRSSIIGLAMFGPGAWFFARRVAPRPGPRRRVAAPVRPRPLRQGRRQLPDRAVALRPGRRRGLRPGLRRRRCSSSPAAASLLPAAAHRPHLRGHHRRARPGRRVRGARSSTC